MSSRTNAAPISSEQRALSGFWGLTGVWQGCPGDAGQSTPWGPGRGGAVYPQSNGKLERFHKTIKGDAIRPAGPSSLDEARAVVARFVDHYNSVRLHSAIGYITRSR